MTAIPRHNGEDKKLEFIGWKGPKIALKAIKGSANSFSKDGK